MRIVAAAGAATRPAACRLSSIRAMSRSKRACGGALARSNSSPSSRAVPSQHQSRNTWTSVRSSECSRRHAAPIRWPRRNGKRAQCGEQSRIVGFDRLPFPRRPRRSASADAGNRGLRRVVRYPDGASTARAPTRARAAPRAPRVSMRRARKSRPTRAARPWRPGRISGSPASMTSTPASSFLRNARLCAGINAFTDAASRNRAPSSPAVCSNSMRRISCESRRSRFATPVAREMRCDALAQIHALADVQGKWILAIEEIHAGRCREPLERSPQAVAAENSACAEGGEPRRR